MMCDVHASVVDVCAGMAAQVKEYVGHAKEIPANTRIVKINVVGGMLHKSPCDVMTATDDPCLITPLCIHA